MVRENTKEWYDLDLIFKKLLIYLKKDEKTLKKKKPSGNIILLHFGFHLNIPSKMLV